MNFKKILLIILICIILIGSFIGYFLYKFFTPVILNSSDNAFNIKIPGKINFKTKNTNNTEYTLDLYSIKDKMFFYTMTLNKTLNESLLDIVNNEKNSLYKADIKNISETSEFKINNYKSYCYNYTYYNSDFNSDFYAEVVWIKTDKNIYIFDFEVIKKNQEKYITIFNDIINSFKENV